MRLMDEDLTSESVSVGVQSFPLRERIWTSFVFKLTATSAVEDVE